MKDSANHNKTKVFRTSSLKSLRYRMAIIVFCLSATFGIQQAQANDYFVTSNGDDGGANTLRGAIEAANANAGADRILFSVSGTIMPATPLPVITGAVIIDGRPGGNPTTALTVELSGAMTTDSANATSNDQFGLQFAASAAGSTVRGLIINRFRNAGIKTAGNNTTILQNYIGTDAAGMSASCGVSPNTVLCGNINQGILIVGSTGNVIGGADASDRNVISGNQGSGIAVTRGGAATIINNYIGVGGNGTTDLGNANDGILIADSSNSVIGGVTAAQRNVISGNNGNGVYIAQNAATIPASGNVVQGNYIGVNAAGVGDGTTGNSMVGNDGSGVVIEAGGNTVGGNTTGARNIISGNRSNGVSLSTNFATANKVSANYIGVSANFMGVASDTTVVRNRLNGVQISNLASNNKVGGTDTGVGVCDNSCNVIANNGDVNGNTGRAGIYLDSSAGRSNSFQRNSIFSNTELGIDLAVPSSSTDTAFIPGTGTTPNDAGDPDTGANDLQNFPELSSADTNGVVSARLDSTPNTTFAIDFYRNAAPDTAATSEARIFIGTIAVKTDNSGIATINFNSGTSSLTAGQFVTATATSTGGAAQAIGDTSEISNAQTVAAATGAAPGFEADVFPRGNGDSDVTSTDVSTIQGFQLGLGLPYQSNEFQRADCAPFDSRGDGFISSIDVSQAQAYQLRINPIQPAAGPTSPSSAPPPTMAFEYDAVPEGANKSEQTKEANGVQVERAVRVQNTSVATSSSTQTVTIPIVVDANGDESVYGFSLMYDSTKLSNPNVTIGNSGGLADFSTPQPGQIGVSVNFGGRGTITAGTGKILVNVTFTLAANAPVGQTPITFTDTPTRREVASNGTFPGGVQALPTTFTSGVLNITAGPTAASVSVSGHVRNSRGTGFANVEVVLVEAAGGQRQTTVTDENGNYRFDNLVVGADYVVTPQMSRFSFTPGSKFVSLTEELTETDFTAVSLKKKR